MSAIRRLSPSERADLVLPTLRALLEREWREVDVILGEFGLPGLDIDVNTHSGVSRSIARRLCGERVT